MTENEKIKKEEILKIYLDDNKLLKGFIISQFHKRGIFQIAQDLVDDMIQNTMLELLKIPADKFVSFLNGDAGILPIAYNNVKFKCFGNSGQNASLKDKFLFASSRTGENITPTDDHEEEENNPFIFADPDTLGNSFKDQYGFSVEDVVEKLDDDDRKQFYKIAYGDVTAAKEHTKRLFKNVRLIANRKENIIYDDIDEQTLIDEIALEEFHKKAKLKCNLDFDILPDDLKEKAEIAFSDLFSVSEKEELLGLKKGGYSYFRKFFINYDPEKEALKQKKKKYTGRYGKTGNKNPTLKQKKEKVAKLKKEKIAKLKKEKIVKPKKEKIVKKINLPSSFEVLPDDLKEKAKIIFNSNLSLDAKAEILSCSRRSISTWRLEILNFQPRQPKPIELPSNFDVLPDELREKANVVFDQNLSLKEKGDILKCHPNNICNLRRIILNFQPKQPKPIELPPNLDSLPDDLKDKIEILFDQNISRTERAKLLNISVGKLKYIINKSFKPRKQKELVLPPNFDILPEGLKEKAKIVFDSRIKFKKRGELLNLNHSELNHLREKILRFKK